MKKNIVIIGAGFAGMWAALSAARLAYLNQRSDIEVTVLAPQPELRVRPRFYEPSPTTLGAPLLPLFTATGVHFCQGLAEKIDGEQRRISYRNQQGELQELKYDRLILASGSQIDRSAISGAERYGFDIDTMEGAERLDKHLHSLSTAEDTPACHNIVVVGGGLTGIELATELPARLAAIQGAGHTTRVIVIDRAEKPGGQFSSDMSATIAEAASALAIDWRSNCSIESIREDGVMLNDGSFIETRTVILTAGVKASPLTSQLAASRDKRGRLMVEPMLNVAGLSDVWATGDVARAACDDRGHLALMTCQHAIPMGKFAGHNAAASLMGIEGLPYSQPNYVTCVDLGAWGAVYTEGWEQDVKSTRSEAKEIKIQITNKLIYPPVAEREAAFTQADPLAPFV